MASCPRDAIRIDGRCACTDRTLAVLGACLPPAAADAFCGPGAVLAPAGQTNLIIFCLIGLRRNSPNQIEYMEGHVGMTEQMGYVSETSCIFQAVRSLPIPHGPVFAFSAKHSPAGSMDI